MGSRNQARHGNKIVPRQPDSLPQQLNNVAIAVQPHSRVVAWGVRALSVRATCVKGGIGAFIYVDAASVAVNGVAW